MVRRIRPLAGRASLAVSVMDILKLSLAPWKRTRDGSAQDQGAAQYVGRQVEVVCNAFGCDASFSDFDLGHPGEPIRGASRQNWSSFCDRRFIGPCRKKESARRLISPVQESLSCKRSKYLCSDRPSKLPTNGSVNR